MPSQPARRTLLAALAATPLAARAQGQPPTLGRVARLLVGFPPGGSADTVARLLAEGLRGAYAPQVIVENRSGAAGRLAIEALKTAEPDGATALVSPSGMITIYPALYGDRLRYAPLADTMPVTPLAEFVFGLAVGPAAPGVDSLDGLIAFARARQVLAYASPAAGSAPHFLGVMLGRRAGVEFTHVPYRGSAPAIQDAVGGQIPCTINVLSELLPHHRTGRLRILATTGAARSAVLPEVPCFAELGHADLTLAEWLGLFLPARTPAGLVEALHGATVAAQREPFWREALARMELTPADSSPVAFAARIRAEQARWAPIVAASGFRAED